MGPRPAVRRASAPPRPRGRAFAGLRGPRGVRAAAAPPGPDDDAPWLPAGGGRWAAEPAEAGPELEAELDRLADAVLAEARGAGEAGAGAGPGPAEGARAPGLGGDPLTAAEVKRLKSLANRKLAERRLCLQQVGKAGISDGVVEGLDKALAKNELVKVRIGDVSDTYEEARDLLGARLKCHTIDMVGHHVLLYRPNAALATKRRGVGVQLKIKAQHAHWRNIKRQKRAQKKREGTYRKPEAPVRRPAVKPPPDVVIKKKAPLRDGDYS